MFTQSLFCGAPVIVGREHLADGHLQALVVNSKNANVATGKQGVDNSREITRLVAQELGIAAEDVLPSSTGVIGQQLPMDRFRSELVGLREHLQTENLGATAQAIMTTDTRPQGARPARWLCRVGGHRQGRGHDRAGHGDDAVIPVHRRRHPA